MVIACATQNWWCKNGEWRAGYFHMLAPVVCPILGVPCWLEVYPYLSLYALLCNSLSIYKTRDLTSAYGFIYTIHVLMCILSCLTDVNLVQTIQFCFDPFIFPPFLDFFLWGFLFPSMNIGFGPLILCLFCEERMVKLVKFNMIYD